MKPFKFILLSILIALATQACGKENIPAPEEAHYFQQDGYLQRVSWQTTPVVMYADLSLTDEQVQALEDAMDIWNEALSSHRNKKPVFKFGGILQKRIGLKNDSMNVVSLTTTWDGGTAEQAETMLLWQGSAIVEADIRVNGEKEFSTLDTGEAGKIDMVALFVHELGHVMGLLHIEATEKQPYSVMSPYLARGDVQRRTVGPVELNAVKYEY